MCCALPLCLGVSVIQDQAPRLSKKFMLNSAEREISNAHMEKISFAQVYISLRDCFLLLINVVGI